MREIRDNMKLLEHRDKEGVNTQAIIDSLSLEAIAEAYKSNYHFSRLLEHNKPLDKRLLLNKRQEKYINWDAQKFIYSIEGKIRDIKNLPKLYSDLVKAPVNLHVRFDNLYFQLVLFALYIRDRS